MRIDSYWSWEEQPAVLVNYENEWLEDEGYEWRWDWGVSAGGNGTREGDLFIVKVPADGT